MNLSFKVPSLKEFEQVKRFIKEYELDSRELKSEEFIVAINNDKVVGFGRLRFHNDCVELCSLGVIVPKRRKGIGKAITKKLISLTDKDIYLACIIPEFFAPFGFKIISNYPESMQQKLNYCTMDLPVPEKYVVMRLEK